RVPGGKYRAPVSVHGLEDDIVREKLDEATYRIVRDELRMLDEAGERFDAGAVLRGELTPVFFGSAVNNFGVELLLDAFLEHAPPPAPRQARNGLVSPAHPAFSGFIFKIQSNMDPKHRDQIAFLRVCSGRFSRDMRVTHSRTGETVRLSSSHKLFARERETVDEAYPGDVIGLVGHPEFGIGDTLTEDPGIVYDEIPRFTPEHFAFLHGAGSAQSKRFRAGLDHLLQEGVVQTFFVKNSPQRVPLLGAVGPLQFEVLQYRLKTEYGADSRLEAAAWRIIRWVDSTTVARLTEEMLPSGARIAEDDRGETVILFTEDWACNFFAERNPEIRLSAVSGAQAAST
ncbi:MAG TPA: EF-Tu/IF-2/RF-3 family GTPase, partial [Methylomirabilota bacterium]|nr:EF-Tu/IF-2/RF-3 family GTPase [Methylomirabilota bacterium]